ncbi:LytTR family transcriptional regulator [Spirosoma sp. HMF3257]|uniref:LytTR family transcriptional regulator n=1 Tax=Spirosoma telluris TaxID=2183553 RepID=A0A327NS14_9BACT|nr:LytTR family transcriptional regulator [Spirosoma telluris]RAI76736.1 LytTR family transcriptional regulator [Spirosoma telluris]
MRRLTTKRAQHEYDPQQVLYLIGNINYCYLYMANNEVILSCRTLKWFSQRWPHFLRVHKKALVNLDYLMAFQPGGKSTATNYITMADETQLEIARRRVPDVRQALESVQIGLLS